MPEELSAQDVMDLRDESRDLKEVCLRLLKRIKRGEFVQALCIIAIVVGAVAYVHSRDAAIESKRVAVESKRVADDLRNLVNDITQQRAEQIVSSCKQFNDQQRGDRSSAVNSLRTLIPEGVEPTAQQQARLDAYAAQVEVDQPYRDCTEAGIKEYLTNPPPDPATTTTIAR